MRKILREALVITANTAICCTLAVLAVDVVKLRKCNSNQLLTERKHTEYDPLLGWINLPNLNLSDVWGPGIGMRTNSQRLRADHDFTKSVPAGKIRVVCSGDSFTLGYGVSNEDAWCQQLAALDPKLETLNMGEGGYGIDQAYLKYKRDGAQFDHQIHIFAVIDADFDRDRWDSFFGVSKPYLKLVDGHLVTRNTPVPRLSLTVPWLCQTALPWMANGGCKSLLVGRLVQALRGEHEMMSGDESLRVISEIVSDLRETNLAKNSRLVLAYLPEPAEYRAKAWSNRLFLKALAQSMGVDFIDVVEDFDKLPPQEIATMYRGHFSERGNAVTARAIYQKLFPASRGPAAATH